MVNPFFYRFPYGKRFFGETPSPLLFTKSFNFLVNIIPQRIETYTQTQLNQTRIFTPEHLH